MNKTNSIIILTVLFFCTVNLQAQKKTYNFVKHFGAKADDKTDCYPALLKAAATLSKEGGGTLIIPKGKYYIASTKIMDGLQKNNVSDVVFKNCTGLTILGNGSNIRINGKFIRKPDYGIPSLPYRYAYENTVCPFVFTNCKNTALKDIVLYGEVDKMKNTGSVEGVCYGVSINDNDADTSSNIQLQNITARHFAADGFLIRSNGKKITMTNCVAFCNARQGLSITKGKDIFIYNCRFDSTGKTGTYGFHYPGAGIDVENEFKAGDVDNVIIRKCHLRNNKGFQIVTTIPSYNVTVDSCFIKDSEEGYASGLNGVGMYGLNSVLTNSIIVGSIQVDLADQIYTGDKIQQIKNNIIYSGDRAIICSDFNRPVIINGNIMIMLPKPQKTYFPYIQSTNCTFTNNIVVMHPDRVKDERLQVIALVQNAKESSNNFWLLNKNNFTNEWLKGYNYYAVALTNTKITKKHFIPQNAYTDAMPFDAKRFITDVQQEKMVNNPICGIFKHTGFDIKHLQQAILLRSYATALVNAVK